MCDVKGKSRTARHARFVSADLDQARIGHPRSQVCETCGGTALRPTLATPRERAPRRAGIHNDIAQLRKLVKNKVGTSSLNVMAGLVPGMTRRVVGPKGVIPGRSVSAGEAIHPHARAMDPPSLA